MHRHEALSFYKNVQDVTNLFKCRTSLKEKMSDEGKLAVISTYGATDTLFKLLRFMGLSMPENFKFLYITYAILLDGYNALFMPFSFTMGLWKGDTLNSDLGAFFTNLQVIFDIYAGSLKIFLVFSMLKRLHGTKVFINRLDERCTEPDEIEEQKYVVQLGRKISRLTVALYLAYSFSTSFGGFINRHPPYAIYFPFIDWRNSKWELYLQIALEFNSINLSCIQHSITDSYATVYVCILRSHVRTLLMRIRRLGKNPNKSPSENMRELILCIQDHQTLIQLRDQIYPLISITVFIQFSVTAIMLGTTMINMMLISTDFAMRLASVVFIVAVVGQAFPICYYAQSLLDESSKLDETIFHSEWIGQNQVYKQTMVYFMHRSQEHMEFQAGKLVPITLNSFLKIAKFSFTLYTFIRKMYE